MLLPGHNHLEVGQYFQDSVLHFHFQNIQRPEVHYPLRLLKCDDCDLVQIDYVVDPKVVFHNEYPYLGGITETLANNLKNGAKKFV